VPYLVDASNLGGVLAGAAGARDAEGVVRFLAAWSRRRGRVVAVFDGEDDGRLARRYGPLEVAWSGAGRSADATILARLRRGAGEWTVVTDDRELARRAREAGAKVVTSRELAQRIERPHSGARAAGRSRGGDKPEPSAADRAHWAKVFGERD
jgi:predicted RNA-binding protein with PIN domain